MSLYDIGRHPLSELELKTKRRKNR